MSEGGKATMYAYRACGFLLSQELLSFGALQQAVHYTLANSSSFFPFSDIQFTDRWKQKCKISNCLEALQGFCQLWGCGQWFLLPWHADPCPLLDSAGFGISQLRSLLLLRVNIAMSAFSWRRNLPGVGEEKNEQNMDVLVTEQ